MAQNEQLPELYCYIFRNIVHLSKKRRFITDRRVFMAMRKVIYKAPRPVMRGILEEFIERYGVLKRINDDMLFIILNTGTKKQLDRLREHVFPIEV